MDLDKIRLEINNADKEITKLLEKRFNLVLEVGKFKKDNNLPIYDAEREKKVIQNCIGYLTNNEYSENLENIYIKIMDECKSLQKTI